MTASDLAGRPGATGRAGPELDERRTGSAPGDADGAGGRAAWLMLGVLLLGQFMAALDVYVVNVALPSISGGLHASGGSLQLVAGAYSIAYATVLVTGARLGALRGRRRTYLAGLAGFTIGSLLCGLAPDTVALIAARAVQGAAAAIMVPQIISVIQTRFAGPARARALSAYTVVLSAGGVAGLMAGGVLVSANLFGSAWRPVFLVNVPIGIVLLALVPRLVPADRPQPDRKLDLAGLGVLAPAMVLTVVPLVLGHEAGWPAWTFAALAAGLVLAWLFVLLQRRIAARGGDPLMNLDVLRAPGFAAGLGTLVCQMVNYGGLLFSFTLYLQSGLGDGPLRAGLTWLPMAVLFGLASFFWRALPERWHPLLPPIGLGVCALGNLGLAAALSGGGQDGALMWVALAGWGAGAGIGLSLLTHSLVHVPARRVADASGLLTTTLQFGQVLGVAAFGSVYLALAERADDRSPVRVTLAAGHAIAVTNRWLALADLVGVAAGLVLARAVAAAGRETRAAAAH
ncbi:MAG TPA: MFS transporter [Actinocrinis sp.]|nr:MFS transporter [Actinocrinis sp.]